MTSPIRAAALFFDKLESRRFLSAALVEGELKIIGTHKADKIDVTIESSSKSQITVTVNGDVRRFPRADVKNINIQAGQGNDFVHVDTKSKLNMTARIYGSNGNDTLISGIGKDRIYGGFGDDSIRGGDNRDVLYGEAGNDAIDGEQGNDVIDGGAQNDTLTGGKGIDYLYGQTGSDTFFAFDNAVDHVDGGGSKDTATVDPDLDNAISIEKLLSGEIVG